MRAAMKPVDADARSVSFATFTIGFGRVKSVWPETDARVEYARAHLKQALVEMHAPTI